MITVFGSINVDLVTRVARIPAPGETVRGSDYALIPGGKGANQALAARRAGAGVRLVGAIGDDGMAAIALRELDAGGVDLASVARLDGTTGLAIISVDDKGEKPADANRQVKDPESGGYVDSVLLDPIAIFKKDVGKVVADGFVSRRTLCTGAYAEYCTANGIA